MACVNERVRIVGLCAYPHSLLSSFEKQGSRTLAAKPVVFEPVSTFGPPVGRVGERVKNKDTTVAQVAERFRALGIRALVQH